MGDVDDGEGAAVHLGDATRQRKTQAGSKATRACSPCCNVQ